MRIREAAELLCLSREQAVSAIEDGILLPVSKARVKLPATKTTNDYDIAELDLDAFIAAFEKQEPGRHPPAAVRRELLVEAKHRCAICRESAPLQFHHMVDWAELKHHDPKHMLAICGTDHDKCTKGIIDYKAQQEYKKGLNASGSSAVAAPSSADLNRERDLGTLSYLLGQVHTRTFDQFFEDAKADRFLRPILHFQAGLHAVVQSSKFHLYDAELLQNVRAFDEALNKCLSFSDHITPTAAGFKFDSQGFHTAKWKENHAEFHASLHAAEQLFQNICRHVRTQYPEIDLDANDSDNWQKYVEFLRRPMSDVPESNELPATYEQWLSDGYRRWCETSIPYLAWLEQELASVTNAFEESAYFDLEGLVEEIAALESQIEEMKRQCEAKVEFLKTRGVEVDSPW